MFYFICFFFINIYDDIIAFSHNTVVCTLKYDYIKKSIKRVNELKFWFMRNDFLFEH